jgi:hypothetical protein
MLGPFQLAVPKAAKELGQPRSEEPLHFTGLQEPFASKGIHAV